MRKIIIVGAALAAGILSGATSFAQIVDPASDDTQAFAESVAKLYEQAAPGVSARVVGRLKLDIHGPNGSFYAYLDTAYSACHRDLAACDSFIRHQVQAMAAEFVAKPSALTLGDLRVTVRTSGYVDQIAAAKDGKEDPIAEPLVGDLWVIGVRDEPTTIATLSKDEIDTLKIDAAGALEVGKRNLEAAMGAKFSAGVAQAKPGAGVAGFEGSSYIASLLALFDLWEPLAERFDGSLYVAAPASDHVIFADARTKSNGAEMARVAKEIAQAAARPLSAEIFVWTPTGWEVADPKDLR